MPGFVSFNEFIARAADSRVEHHAETIRAGLTGTAVPPLRAAAGADGPAAVGPDVVEQEFAKMKKYVLDHYKGATATHTFLDAAGNFMDCIPIEQHPCYRAAKEAGWTLPKRPPAATRGERVRRHDPESFGPITTPIIPPLRKGAIDLYGKRRMCPEGSVPVRRLSLERLAWYGQFENFFRKAPPPPPQPVTPRRGRSRRPPPLAQPGPDGAVHRHAICQTRGNFTGCFTWLNVWDMPAAPGVFNLSQLWILDSQPAPGSQFMATIESGWQVWYNNLPQLFVFYNPDGYRPGGRSGYVTNAQHFGFVPYSNTWAPDQVLDNDEVSQMKGPQHGLQMQWEMHDDGSWWLYVGYENTDPTNMDAVGCFPKEAYQGTGLTNGVSLLQFGGEVCSHQKNPATGQLDTRTGPMGSGNEPSGSDDADFRTVAFQKNISVQTDIGAPWTQANLEPGEFSDGDGVYSASEPNHTNDWGSYFFFGGDNGP